MIIFFFKIVSSLSVLWKNTSLLLWNRIIHEHTYIYRVCSFWFILVFVQNRRQVLGAEDMTKKNYYGRKKMEIMMIMKTGLWIVYVRLSGCAISFILFHSFYRKRLMTTNKNNDFIFSIFSFALSLSLLLFAIFNFSVCLYLMSHGEHEHISHVIAVESVLNDRQSRQCFSDLLNKNDNNNNIK